MFRDGTPDVEAAEDAIPHQRVTRLSLPVSFFNQIVDQRCFAVQSPRHVRLAAIRCQSVTRDEFWRCSPTSVS